MLLGKVMLVFGTRPEAIKMAPLVKALQVESGIDTKVLVTAQHRDMLDQVLELFAISPDYDLDLMKTKQDLYGITSGVLNGVRDILQEERPDLMLVHGDTTTTMAASLGAFYEKIPAGHVEAGLRTYNKFSPFPEEMNRRLTGSIAELHFAPTVQAQQNLLNEGVAQYKIWVTGNTVIDALLSIVHSKYNIQNLTGIDWERRLVLLTVHRRENWGAPMQQVYEAVNILTQRFPDVQVVFPVHRNPLVHDMAVRMLGANPQVCLTEPLDYADFVHLMNASYIIMTDSGGLQEEAPALGKPVLLLRDTTERPEAVEAGTVKLVGTVANKIVSSVTELLQDETAYALMAQAANPYGDGTASQKIVEIIKGFLYARKGVENR